MQAFQEFVVGKHIEPIMLELAAGMACCNLDPERWLLEWVRKNYPLAEASVLHEFNQLVISEADGPFPGKGGMLSGLKNWWNSMKGGAQQGWQQGKSQYQNLMAQQIEDAFQNAFKYVNTLVNVFGKDPRIQQLKQQNPQMGNIAQQLTQMRDGLRQLGQKVGNSLQGNVGQENLVTPEVVPEGPQNPSSTQGESPESTQTQNVPPPSLQPFSFSTLNPNPMTGGSQMIADTGRRRPTEQPRLAAMKNGPASTQINTSELPQGANVADTGYFNWKPVDTYRQYR